MRVLIIGWYGTETIGDRAILAGIVQFLTKIYGDIHVTLGSLNPFFSERTIKEDYDTFVKTSTANIDFSLVDSTSPKLLEQAISCNEIIVMGGGPLMDLSELHMVDYAFKRAKKLRKKTAILGSGVGPLFKKKFKKVVLSIVNNSDVTVLRDESSYKNLKKIASEFSVQINNYNSVWVGFDPAAHYGHQIRSIITPKNENFIAVNLRSFPIGYSQGLSYDEINNCLIGFIDELSNQFSEQEIRLIPMHYFEVGDDDRYFLNKIKFSIDKANLIVQNRPLSLEETIVEYSSANFNIGMRFHSVVLQTIVSGKNYVLDYTQPKIGKISGFLNDIDLDSFYSRRYVSLQQGLDINMNSFFDKQGEKFHYKDEQIAKSLKTYETALEALR